MTDNDLHVVTWIDAGREPVCLPDPTYPTGKDIMLTPAARSCGVYCTVKLPYPAPRCGAYHVTCRACSISMVITTAGRADDPRSIEILCNRPSKSNSQ